MTRECKESHITRPRCTYVRCIPAGATQLLLGVPRRCSRHPLHSTQAYQPLTLIHIHTTHAAGCCCATLRTPSSAPWRPAACSTS